MPGYLFSMRQIRPNAKMHTPIVGYWSRFLTIGCKKKDGTSRPFFGYYRAPKGHKHYSEKYMSYSAGCTDMRMRLTSPIFSSM